MMPQCTSYIKAL